MIRSPGEGGISHAGALVALGTMAFCGVFAGGGMVHEGQSVCDIGPRSRFFVAGGTGGGFSRPTRITVNTVSRVDFVVTSATGNPKAHTAGSREMAELAFVAMDHADY